MTDVFFNLLVNSTFSMASGLLIVGFFIWLFRVESGPWKLFLLSLPFVKIVYDSVRGLPPDSVLLNGLDPFSMPPRSQLLQIGAGFSPWGPEFKLIFSVRDLAGREFATSVGDYLVIWLNRNFGDNVPLAFVIAILTVSMVWMSLRMIAAWRFERRRGLDRTIATPIRKQQIGLRSVDIYISNEFIGSPFTGGLFRPYICIPRDAHGYLEERELEAVIAHELGHIRQIDFAVTFLVQLLGDVFWFVPGYHWLSRKIDRLREIVADQWAVRSGAEPVLLASALVKLKEIPEQDGRFALYSAFFREKSLLKIRVQRLLGQDIEKSSRFGWSWFWFRSLVSVWIVTAVMIATLGGNHQVVRLKNPEWVERILKDLKDLRTVT
jgi:Zn-dependent protease with chaperone function